MRLSTFLGGVHPPENKHLSKDIPIRKAPIPEKVVVFMQQHAGSPAKPIVNPGDKVKTGQVIGEPTGFISSYVHSPVTGTVTDVKKVTNVIFGKAVEVVEIEREGEDKWELLPHGNFEKFSPEELVDIIKRAGIVGLGGAMFPTHVKLTPPKDKKIDTLVINGAECEPYLTIDHRMMLEKYEEILIGIEIVKKILGIEKAIIGIEDNKLDAIDLLENKWKGKVDVKALKTKYPQGAEKQLIYATTNRKVPRGKLPMDVGVVVLNVSTLFAIKEAVIDGKPLIERGLTVTGEAINKPGNWWVRIGTPISWVIERLGEGLKSEAENVKVLMGGPMMGIPINNIDTPLVKGNNGITTIIPKEQKSTFCIRCSYCVNVCPMGLQPYLLDLLGKKKRYDEAAKIGLLDCIECGSCTYICPAKIEHVKTIKLTKKVYKALRGGRK
ncbi:electron transporter RnfC [Thermosipho melanesiensis]|uniref:Ion-translocating oxidoreductase complex subunit C n=2 Tax=Thermosipho melanesiensis TaxID=46541 RepID=A6LNB4_THEM4|nr:electron transport complex subunit RsxC [Thermosipho melanesiensis]ABR31415.1 electron transport complex, RnfABCDGE type, C subunit [Thermosipho melanesiensis BI429]APT74474.1 electron transporter RnfC [Thermosipho melanesiensis]OOC36434.1 electron transporter RnfC [Thermosipho melanesiensis]OOC37252.1 electron transporter RnfC [Thermosipho melanesiensis]OOC38004.1 electron transporter RnfC [Thermosipho melanesiensis]